MRVSELALGTGNFGTRWGHGAERNEAKRVVDRFAEAGANFIDTADSYQFGESEELVGDFIASNRDGAAAVRTAVDWGGSSDTRGRKDAGRVVNTPEGRWIGGPVQ